MLSSVSRPRLVNQLSVLGRKQYSFSESKELYVVQPRCYNFSTYCSRWSKESLGEAREEDAEIQLIRDEIEAAKLKLQLIKDNTKIVKGKVVALEHDISPLSKGHADDGSGSKEAKNVNRLVGEEIKVESREPSHTVS